jgi:hypothetical protein
MAEKKNEEQKSAEDSKESEQVSKTEASADEQKDDKAAVSAKSVPDLPDQPTPDILTTDVAEIFEWMEKKRDKPNRLKKFLDQLDTRIDLINDILSKENAKAKRVPSVDKRIETMELYDTQLEVGEKYLSELNKIKLSTELANLKEKRYQVWKKFVSVYGSEKKDLQSKNLKSKAKSEYYHNKTSYFVKSRILKILNTIIKEEKQSLVDIKKLAENTSEEGVKEFNKSMRDLLDVYDEDLVILTSHKNREKYYMIMQLTINKWDPEADNEIEELVLPEEENK